MKKIALCFAALVPIIALAAAPAFACPHEDKAAKENAAAQTADKTKAKEAPKADKAKAKEATKPAEKTASK